MREKEMNTIHIFCIHNVRFAQYTVSGGQDYGACPRKKYVIPTLSRMRLDRPDVPVRAVDSCKEDLAHIAATARRDAWDQIPEWFGLRAEGTMLTAVSAYTLSGHSDIVQ